MNFLGRQLIKLNIGKDAYIITNALIKRKFGDLISRNLKKSGLKVKFKTVPDTEKSKSITRSAAIIKDLAAFDRQKRLFIVALGGGVIGDLAGFVASIYKRGVPFVQIPTTLLAQVDSSIGGKTAVDLEIGKNLVGSFYQPRLVFSDVEFLKTLGRRQLCAGLAEVIKYGLIKDRALFALMEKDYKKVLSFNPGVLDQIVIRCSRIKAKVVSLDEKEERGLRTILNFGHTIGHAIEASGGYKGYNHGEAVALGILVAADISAYCRLTKRSVVERIEKLFSSLSLPTKIKKVSFCKIINAHYHDKKFIGRKNRFVLLSGIGKTKIVEDVPLEIIKKALRNRF
jgi:3-dehydroquinate synthase